MYFAFKNWRCLKYAVIIGEQSEYSVKEWWVKMEQLIIITENYSSQNYITLSKQNWSEVSCPNSF